VGETFLDVAVCGGEEKEERQMLIGRATIRKFVASGQFIEVLTCFENGMTEEVSYMNLETICGVHTYGTVKGARAAFTDIQMSQKLSYARWKANDGAKALREGRTPVSGPRTSSNISSY
jgi:vacuolar protein sorting-associated protein VTA1